MFWLFSIDYWEFEKKWGLELFNREYYKREYRKRNPACEKNSWNKAFNRLKDKLLLELFPYAHENDGVYSALRKKKKRKSLSSTGVRSII